MRALHRAAPPIAGLLALMLASALAACAKRPPASDTEAVKEFEQTNDPLEPMNRAFYRVNAGFDAVLLKPLAEGYRYAVPRVVRHRVHNVLANLTSPVLLSNDMMQGHPKRAGTTLMRFVINSTVGIAGLWDPATGFGYPAHDNDFGITLALWGVPSGPFLFLPVLGPSSPREFAGVGADIALDPFTWIGQGADVTALEYSRYGMSAVDARERVLDEVASIKKTALDPYATFRSLYRQHRASLIEQARKHETPTVPAWYPQPARTNKSQPAPAAAGGE
jgi:phospholipid-binding lipoprotein MlaA